MSCAVEALVERQMRLLGDKTYGLLQRLHEEYQHALTEFQERCESEQQAREDFAEQQELSTRAALDLVARTAVTPASAGIAGQFIAERVEHLYHRIVALPVTEAAFAAHCRALLQAIAETPERMPEHIGQYQRLSEAFTALLAKQGNTALLHETLAEELRVLREELEAPLLSVPAFAETRGQLLAQLTALEQLGVRQIAMADQGLLLLRQRVRRELKTAVEQEHARRRDAVEIREQVGDILAKLRALSRLSGELPDIAANAEQLLGRLTGILGGSMPDEANALRKLAQEVHALFEDSARQLEEHDAAAYLGDQVTDILLSMGYEVTQLPSDAGTQQLVTGIDDAVGVQFRIEGRGRLGTRMVALSDDGAENGERMQEKICALVDDVFAALNRRNCRVRERFRSALAPGESLEVVPVPETEKTVTPQDHYQPKQMGLEQ